MSESRRTRANKDADLLKIQILADYYQAQFSYVASIVAGVIAGLLIADIGIYFSLGQFAFDLWLIAVFVALIWYSGIINNGYHSDLENIDKLFIRIQNGETLESITELRRKYQRQHKPITQILFRRV